jgi:hypothetical protein
MTRRPSEQAHRPNGLKESEREMHQQVGKTTFSVNEYGARIEHTVWTPSRLDDGRCCGRKPNFYKTRKGWDIVEYYCCFRCDREYASDGVQRQNYAYKLDEKGNYRRDTAEGRR